MRDTELYERSLGLKEPWKVKAVKMDVEGRRVEVEVECAERTIWASPEGRQRLHIHGWETRSWRHLDTCGFATVIRAEVPRVKDEKGQTETVTVPWAEKFSRFTRSFEAFGVKVLRAARSLKRCLRVAFHFLGSGPSPPGTGGGAGFGAPKLGRTGGRRHRCKEFFKRAELRFGLKRSEGLSGAGGHGRPGTSQCRATFRERGARTAAKSGSRGDGHECSF